MYKCNIRIYRIKHNVLTKRSDSPVMMPSTYVEDQWQFEKEPNVWAPIPIIIDAESHNKAEAFVRQWSPFNLQDALSEPVEIQEEMPL